MFTIEPRLASIIPGKTCFAQRNMLVKLTASIRFQSARLRRCAGDSCAIPALLASTSTGPNSLCPAARMASTSASTLTSVRRKMHCPPAFRISSAVEFPASALMSAASTFAPCCATSTAIAFPIPIAAPVTRATRPCSRNMPPRSSAGPTEISHNVTLVQRTIPKDVAHPGILATKHPAFLTVGLTELGMEYIHSLSQLAMPIGISLLMPVAGASSAATLALGAGVLNGSFATPTQFMNRWKWENVWGLWALFAMLVLPWVVAFATVPHLMACYESADVRRAFLLVILFGAGYGVAAVCFGLGVDAL